MSKKLIGIIEEKFSNNELPDLVAKNYSFTGVLRSLGYSSKGQYISLLRDKLSLLGISTKHFTPNGSPPATRVNKTCINCGHNFSVFNRPSDLKQETCSIGCANTVYRSGKYKEGSTTYRKKALSYYGCKCYSCGIDNKAVLQVHHIDQNRANNAIENLKVLCANCHLLEHSMYS